MANLSGIFQRKGSSAKRCDKTALLPYITPTGYLTPGRESEGRRRAVRVNKGVHPSQKQISSGFELLPRLLTHLRPLSFQCVSGESRGEKKQQNIYTLPDQSFVWAIETVAVCFSQCFVFHVWFSVVTSKSFPRKQ